jgi:hypothetical protein
VSTVACCNSGFDSSTSTVPAVTSVPGCTLTRSTKPCCADEMMRMFSGTSVPAPRTWRSISPRFTVPL